jgi:glucose/arabinose dehydrogenase
MFDSQLYRKLSFTAAVLGLLTVAGCSNQPGTVASQKTAGAASGNASAAAAANPAASPEVSPAGSPADATKPLHLVTLPKGTEITATVGQTLASAKSHWGDSFAASIARPVKVNGKTVLPRGTEVTGRIYEVKKDELKVVLSSVVIHGVYCDLTTNSRRPSDKVQPKRNGQKINTRKQKKDNSTLSASTRLVFKLSKPVTIPTKA